MRKKNSNKENLIHFLLCGACLFVVIFLIIYPRQTALNDKEDNIRILDEKIDEQEKLLPIFTHVLRKLRVLEDFKGELQKNLILSEKSSNKVLDTENLSAVFQKIARENNFRIQSIQPDENSLNDVSGYLIINVTMTGSFTDLYYFLLQLISVPYVRHIEQIHIQTRESTKTVQLRIWLIEE